MYANKSVKVFLKKCVKRVMYYIVTNQQYRKKLTVSVAMLSALSILFILTFKDSISSTIILNCGEDGKCLRNISVN